MSTLNITKRIQPTSAGYICFLNDTSVGTATSYSEAERVCATAYETLLHAPVASPAIRMQPIICEDQLDHANYGQETGVSFFAGAGVDAIELHIPNASHNPHDVPCIYTADDVRITLDELERIIPILAALLNDARVQQARAARLGAVQRRAA